MKPISSLLVLSVIWLIIFYAFPGYAESCTSCHKEIFQPSKFHPQHVITCEQCHGGNPEAVHKETAHLDLEPYPGRMKSVEKSCGQSQCHTDLVPMVKNSIMNTLDGMLTVTREVYNEENAHHQNRTVAERLDTAGADSYLRKLCVSCHLGSERKNHAQSYRDRGGGCSACHLQTFQKKEIPQLDEDPDVTGVGTTHPVLTVQISNDRCFGCHSRSGRISLNYLGLAEVEKVDQKRINQFGYLYDNRLVEQKTADLHADRMACIDCHTMNGLMGTGARVPFLRDQNDIACEDCHDPRAVTKKTSDLTPREHRYFSLYRDRIKLDIADETIVTQKTKSPLYHVIQKKSDRYIISKLTGKEIPIPLSKDVYYHTVTGHDRLTCDSCHTAWAPQCYGCHVEFKPDETQFDHIEQKRTEGRWVETRWYVKSELPALGVTGLDTITTFVPGMNIISEKTPKSKKFTKQIFAATSAHTTQKKGRSCASCHQSDESLAIIKNWVSHPSQTHWKTPIGWISENQKIPGAGTKPGDRSFNQKEIRKIRLAGKCLECHQENDAIYQNYYFALKNLTPACKVE